MDPVVADFVNSIIVFCKCSLQIPIALYTSGLKICPWVSVWLNIIKETYGIDIIGTLPLFQEVLNEIDKIAIEISQL